MKHILGLITLIAMMLYTTSDMEAQKLKYGTFYALDTFTNAVHDTTVKHRMHSGMESVVLIQYALDISLTGTTTGNFIVEKSPDGTVWGTHSTITAADGSAILVVDGTGFPYWRLRTNWGGTSTVSLEADWATFIVPNGRKPKYTAGYNIDTLTNADTAYVLMDHVIEGWYNSNINATVELISGSEALVLGKEVKIHPNSAWILLDSDAWAVGGNTSPIYSGVAMPYPFVRYRLLHSGTGVVGVTSYWTTITAHGDVLSQLALFGTTGF